MNVTGQDYYCHNCGVWLDMTTVETFNEEFWGADDDGPEVCPTCHDEVVWWSSAEGKAIAAEQAEEARPAR